MSRHSRPGSIPSRAAVTARKPVGLVATLFQKAVDRQQAGDLKEAESTYRAILAVDASHAMVWSNLSVLLLAARRSDEAIEACRAALKLSPDHFNAQLNLATALQQAENWPAAEAAFRSILARHPHRPDLWKNLGAVLERAERPAEAIKAYDAMIAVKPDDTVGYNAKADVLKALGRIDEAVACYRAVLRLAPDDAMACSSLGILLALHSVNNDLMEATNFCLKGAMLQPGNAPILNNLGVVLQVRDETDKALIVLRQLNVEHPNFAPAYSNIGSILSSKMRYDEAEVAFLKALELDGSLAEAKIELTKVRRHLCNWAHHESDAATIRGLKGKGTNFMIVLMAISPSGTEQLGYARASMARYNGRAPSPKHRNAFDPRRLRIGYISADFRDHPVGRLIPDIIAGHDRDRFEVFGYSLGPSDPSVLRRRIAASFDQFADFKRLSDADAATKIREDAIDILVDLTGPTAGGRFEILAQRPAPVQVSFLGLPGTSGADCIDYILADRYLIPDGSQPFYSENVVRLPGCYQPSDMARRLLQPLPSRADCGLPEHGFVFCSFNSPIKISPEVFDLWMRLLHAVDGSVLWLYCRSAKSKDNLTARAARCGIGPDRLVFAGAAPYDIYLTRMVCADLFLDSFPYAAGATCNDALWAGLPVLTCVGETYVSRMAGSLLTALGLEELVTTSLDDYERKALDLAADPERLARLKQKLVVERQSNTLFDMRSFAGSLEGAYRRMAEIAASGAAPHAFDVD